nr:hypothetical protein [Candidatus Bathyarchaeota archaeon]
MREESGMVNVRTPCDVSEFHLCEDLQRRVWGTDNPVPAHMLIAGHRNGGLLLIAFDEELPVGFCFGITGREGDNVYFYSHMAGVLPEVQNKGVGYLLKLKQREYALRMGFNLMKWTYDPLQSRNARFNVGKLGVICRRYIANYYGEMRDRLNAGYESDRFIAEWWLTSRRVLERIRHGGRTLTVEEVEGATLATETERCDGGFRRIVEVRESLNEEKVLVEIPRDIGAIRERNMSLAVDWRRKTRVVFQSYLSKGYVVSEFATQDSGGERRSFYVLVREELLGEELGEE